VSELDIEHKTLVPRQLRNCLTESHHVFDRIMKAKPGAGNSLPPGSELSREGEAAPRPPLSPPSIRSEAARSLPSGRPR
jgi:hypothetical protein